MEPEIFNELRVTGPADELARFRALAEPGGAGEAFSFVRLVNEWTNQTASMNGETQALAEDLGARPVAEVSRRSTADAEGETSVLYKFTSGQSLPVACVKAASELFPSLAFLLSFENVEGEMRGRYVINCGETLEHVQGEFGPGGREAYDRSDPLPDIFALHEGRAPGIRPLCYTTFGENRFLVAVTNYRVGDAPALILHRGQYEYLGASVNLPGAPLDEGEVFVRNTEENEGALAALAAAGVVTDTGRAVQSGFIKIHVCRLSERAAREYKAIAPGAGTQSVARVIVQRCHSCGTHYVYLATVRQEARYFAEPRLEAIQNIFPLMLNSARSVLSNGNICTLCIDETDAAFAAAAPHMLDTATTTFLRGGDQKLLLHTRYLDNGRPALVLLEMPDRLVPLTTNLPDVEAEGDEVFIVDSRETAGLRAELARQLFLEGEGTPVGDTHPRAYRCKLIVVPPPPPSDPEAALRAEEAEAREGFVPGSHRRFRYVVGGEVAAPACRRGDALYEHVAEFPEAAPGARALIAGRYPSTADPVPLHVVFRRRTDGLLFAQTYVWHYGSDVTPRSARQVSAPARPRPRVPHDEALARELGAGVFTRTLGELAAGLNQHDGERLLVVGEGNALEEVAAFYTSPPVEDSEGVAHRLLLAGAVTQVVRDSGDELQAYDGHEVTPCDLDQGQTYRALRVGLYYVVQAESGKENSDG